MGPQVVHLCLGVGERCSTKLPIFAHLAQPHEAPGATDSSFLTQTNLDDLADLLWPRFLIFPHSLFNPKLKEPFWTPFVISVNLTTFLFSFVFLFCFVLFCFFDPIRGTQLDKFLSIYDWITQTTDFENFNLGTLEAPSRARQSGLLGSRPEV